jgi:hypothetical protein
MNKMSLLSWKSDAGLAGLAVYAPFIVMAIYTLLFVSCSHCKTAAWKLLPCAPGLFLVELGRHCLDLPRPDDELSFTLASIASLGAVLFLSFMMRCGRWPRWTGLVVALTLFSIAAFGLLAAIRA